MYNTFILCLCVCVELLKCPLVHVEARGDLLGVGSLPPPCGPRG